MTGDADPRTVRLILDNSSIAAYTRGSIAVGELLSEVDDEHGDYQAHILTRHPEEYGKLGDGRIALPFEDD